MRRFHVVLIVSRCFFVHAIYESPTLVRCPSGWVNRYVTLILGAVCKFLTFYNLDAVQGTCHR